MTTRYDEQECRYCHHLIYLFDKAPIAFAAESGARGWAEDNSGDVLDDFICPSRDSSGRWPDGKPHEPWGE